MEEDEIQIKYSEPGVSEKMTSRILDISWGTIIKITLALGALYLIFLVRDILIWFIFALIISILFNPAINFLRKARIPRVLAAILVYLGIFTFLGFFIYLLAPLLFSELQQFSVNLSAYLTKPLPILVV